MLVIMLFSSSYTLYCDDLFHTGSCNVSRVESPTQPVFKPIIAPTINSGVNIYTYFCPRCGLIQNYTIAGIHNCPNDRTMMILK
jgi:hypothetical protein